jgi:hypothetical protein
MGIHSGIVHGSSGLVQGPKILGGTSDDAISQGVFEY